MWIFHYIVFLARFRLLGSHFTWGFLTCQSPQWKESDSLDIYYVLRLKLYWSGLSGFGRVYGVPGVYSGLDLEHACLGSFDL